MGGGEAGNYIFIGVGADESGWQEGVHRCPSTTLARIFSPTHVVMSVCMCVCPTQDVYLIPGGAATVAEATRICADTARSLRVRILCQQR